MDLQRALARPGGRPGTSLTDLPEYIISTFIPGALPLLSRYPKLFRFLGLLAGLYYFSPIARLTSLWTQFSSFFTATISVQSDEDLFEYLVSYLSQPTTRTIRSTQALIATSNTSTILPSHTRRRRHDPDFEDSLNRRSAPNVPPIKYTQSQGLQLFIHNRRVFFISRKDGDGHTYDGGRARRMEVLAITCLGRSPEPIKHLFEEVHAANKASEQSLTIIRRPYNSGGYNRLAWSRVTAKPRRALETVILDPVQKDGIITDIDEYMSPATQAFYGDHGIPYRRGYLFYGPPGVGKTSFAMAIASRFELDVYVLTLLDKDIGDSDLIALLQQLPGRSVLLLEDIDTAGLSRKPRASTRQAATSVKQRRMMMREGAVAKASQSATADDDESDADEVGEPRSKVSLSGLLNAIDGVAAPEGHLLIMTTNKPDELDEALVRAGRVSVHVGFRNATKAQAEEMFLKMFDGDKVKADEKPESIAESAEPDVKSMAQQFASKIEDYEFSPADLQDYLLVRKKEPALAVSEVEEWRAKWQEEKMQREEEKEAERVRRSEARERKARKFREELEMAVVGANAKMNQKGGDSEGQAEAGQAEVKGAADAEQSPDRAKKETTSTEQGDADAEEEKTAEQPAS